MKSIVSYPDRGQGGRNSYRGNCSPRMIEDIIEQYQIHGCRTTWWGQAQPKMSAKKQVLRVRFWILTEDSI